MTSAMTSTAARRALRALRTGVVPDVDLVDGLFVGQTEWVRHANLMVDDNALDEDFEVRFVRARYGGGKTAFLRRMERDAASRGLATAYVMLRHGRVELDKPYTVARELAEQVSIGDEGRGMGSLLRSAILGLGRSCGYNPPQTNSLATHDRLVSRMNEVCASTGFGFDVTLALRSGCRGLLSRDEDRLQLVARWLGGGPEALSVPGKHVGESRGDVILKPIGVGAAEQVLRLVAVLVRMSGRPGLVIALDEVELLAALPPRRRDNAFQTLRAFVDQKDARMLPPSTSLFLAATPQMFEDPAMFPRYKALQDRIEVLRPLGGRHINYRAPVIDLDSTELQGRELHSLGTKLLELFRLSGGQVPGDAPARLLRIVSAIEAQHFVVARPRLLCRSVLDMLDGQVDENAERAVAILSDELSKTRSREVAVEETS